jgi:hypothetical protein
LFPQRSHSLKSDGWLSAFQRQRITPTTHFCDNSEVDTVTTVINMVPD